ncbi:hypothetical protein [Brucella cytisi]|uniref:hypothetical protein n=1 Tax=Brucella cytisi TaxID=407152 RepID=UPI00313F0545
MINVTINWGEVDYLSPLIAVLSLIVSIAALLYTARQFSLSSEMNYATMTTSLLEKLNSHSSAILKANEEDNADDLRFAIIDFANDLDLACTFRISHNTKGRISDYFAETLDGCIELLNSNPEWLDILGKSIVRKDEFTGLKDYATLLPQCSSLQAILGGQRRRIKNPRPWVH